MTFLFQRTVNWCKHHLKIIHTRKRKSLVTSNRQLVTLKKLLFAVRGLLLEHQSIQLYALCPMRYAIYVS